MNLNLVNEITKAQMKNDLTDLRPGMTVKVGVKIKEGDKTRVQVFEGVVIARDGGEGNNASFTVRRESYGVGVERKFPLYSPAIEKIEKVRIGRVRRAKLFFLRKLSGKKARIVEDLAATSCWICIRAGSCIRIPWHIWWKHWEGKT